MKRHIPYDRSARLADQIYRIVSETCYNDLSDPRLEGVQITQVRMTKDLRTARVYFHLLDADEPRIDAAKRALMSARGFLKRAVGQEVELKYMPEFEFFYDDTADVREHIDEIFEKLERKEHPEG